MNLDIGGRLIASMNTAARKAVIAELSNPEPTRAGCMACGRSIDAQKARKGGWDRFCSERCQDAFDEGWPIYGTTPADYVRVVEHRKLKSVPKTTRKARKKVLRPQRIS